MFDWIFGHGIKYPKDFWFSLAGPGPRADRVSGLVFLHHILRVFRVEVAENLRRLSPAILIGLRPRNFSTPQRFNDVTLQRFNVREALDTTPLFLPREGGDSVLGNTEGDSVRGRELVLAGRCEDLFRASKELHRERFLANSGNDS